MGKSNTAVKPILQENGIEGTVEYQISTIYTPGARAPLFDRVSAGNAKRLETIHSRVVELGHAKNLSVTAKELGCLIYEILQMPIVDGPAVDKGIADRLDEQRRRIYQAAGSVQTVMKAIDALDDEGMDHDMVALWSSLSLVRDTLKDIAGQLEVAQ